MYGLHPAMGTKGVIFALILEVCFLGFCIVFIGLGTSEIRKGKPFFSNALLICLGFFLAAVSVYVTKLLIEG